ncbi:MAG: cupin domain-containing protein [Thermodesulfobacteriota bacterium]
MDDNKILDRLKRLRRERGHSLDHLAQLTGLSKGYLSKIENAAHLPPFSTLHRLASALGVDLTYLFTDQTDRSEETKITLVRREERQEIMVDIHGMLFRHWPLASEKTGRNLDPYIIEIPPDNYQVYRHEGEEFYLVLEGRVELDYGGVRYVLAEGDCVYFDTDVPHSGRGMDGRPAKALVVFHIYKKVMREPFTGGLVTVGKQPKIA